MPHAAGGDHYERSSDPFQQRPGSAPPLSIHPLLLAEPRRRSEPSLTEPGLLGEGREHPLLTFDPFAPQPSLDLGLDTAALPPCEVPGIVEPQASAFKLQSFAPQEFASELDFPLSPR